MDSGAANALAADPRFAWSPGMRLLYFGHPPAWIVLCWREPVGRWNACGPDGAWTRLSSLDNWTLDLLDDATGGALLGMLWAADPSFHVHRDGNVVLAHVAPGVCEYVGATLGEAVGRALLATWGRS